MHYTILAQELGNDPLAVGYASMTDAEAAVSLNTANRQVVEAFRGSWRNLMAALGPQQAATIKAKIETAAQTDAGLSMAIGILNHYGEGGGIDFGHQHTRDAVDALTTAAVLTAEEAAAVKALAERTVSRAEELGLDRVRPGHVQKARAQLT